MGSRREKAMIAIACATVIASKFRFHEIAVRLCRFDRMLPMPTTPAVYRDPPSAVTYWLAAPAESDQHDHGHGVHTIPATFRP